MKRTAPLIKKTGPLPEIFLIGISVWDPIYSQREHAGAHWEVVHIVRGVVTLHLEGRKFRGEAGDTLLIPAGTLHRDEFLPGTEFEVLHLVFDWDNAPVFFKKHINSELARLHKADRQTIRNLAFNTYDCFMERRAMREEMTQACLLRLLLFLKSCVGELTLQVPVNEMALASERRKLMIRTAKEFIQSNLNKPMMLSDIAAHLGISAYHLSHIFSEESGFTLSSYLISSRMEKAAKLLNDPKLRISEIAYQAGFEDPNYFGKAFRRHFGCSPGSFRNRQLKTRKA